MIYIFSCTNSYLPSYSQTGLADSDYKDYTDVIAADELAHVKALRATLGNRTAMSPAIDVSQGSSSALYQAAMYTTPPAMPNPFNAFASGVSFLIALIVFKDVGEFLCLTLLSCTLSYVQTADISSLRNLLWSTAGVTAYAGAAAGLNSTDVLSAAAKIMGIEASPCTASAMLLRSSSLMPVATVHSSILSI
jgi:Ferritin-like domain